MNRGKRLIRNLFLILAVLFLFGYFRGYYVSKQQCVMETLRGHYGTETREIMEIKRGNYIVTLMADKNDESFSLVGTKKVGFLYQTASGLIGKKINKEKCMTIAGEGSSDRGFLACIFRNDKSIEKVEVQFENGETYLITDWQEDYACFMREGEEWWYGTYRAYNAEGELVGEEMY